MFRLDTSHPQGADSWAMPPTAPIRWLWANTAGTTQLLDDTFAVLQQWPTPIEALRWLAAQQLDLSPTTRWVGYLGYDLGRFFETLPRHATDDLKLPLLLLGLCDTASSAPPTAPRASTSAATTPPPTPTALATDNFTRPVYEAAVARAIEYVRAGDIFQVNLSQRLTRPLTAPPADIYARLLARTPAHYGAHLEVPSGPWGEAFSILSNSPELFLRLTPAGHITTRPIKGTRPLGPGNADALARSEKDQAELAMIVDLLRNDLGRVAQIGSVRVTDPRTIETHPTLHHGVSTIEAQLRPGLTLADLLAATFPCGSVTGAPKIRAMQIIDELEPTRRGVYCGAIGYLARDLTQWNVAIRTMTAQFHPAPLIHLPVGGGIVADSTPESEYEETLVKARAMLAALKA